jgi:hypothetical protein
VALSSPGTLGPPASRIREDFSPDHSPAPPAREPSLPSRLGHIRSDLPYLNPPSPVQQVHQLDGAGDIDDIDDNVSPFQSPARPPAGMDAATATDGDPELPELGEGRTPGPPPPPPAAAGSGLPAADPPPPPTPPPPPPAAGSFLPAVHLRYRIEGGDIHTLGMMGKWVRARGGDFVSGYFSCFKDIKDLKGAIWM